MTVKEMEVLSEMTRANIRFYELEGLLAPARSANGYAAVSGLLSTVVILLLMLFLEPLLLHLWGLPPASGSWGCRSPTTAKDVSPTTTP